MIQAGVGWRAARLNHGGMESTEDDLRVSVVKTAPFPKGIMAASETRRLGGTLN
jgi:hypothetical protein